MDYILGLVPDLVIGHSMWWQVVTYMFVHGGIWHILFNMLMLFTFGMQLERHMGSWEFLLFYFVCGIGAGLLTIPVNYLTGLGSIPVVGASGALIGVSLAFAAFYPEARILIFGILPMRAPTAVLVFAGIDLLMLVGEMVTGLSTGVAHLTHLSGFLFGFLYLLIRYRINAFRVFFRR